MARIEARARPMIEPILQRPLVAEGLQASEWFGRRGGGLLAAGLAFRALFAVLAALLFTVGLLGLLIADPDLRTRLLEAILVLVPEPLQAPFTDVITKLAEERWTISLLGLLGLLWGAGALYQSVDQCLSVLMPGGRQRSPLAQRLRGLVLLLGMIGAVSLSVLFTVILPQFQRPEAPGWLRLVAGTIVSLAAVTALVLAAYRWGPARGPSWRQAFPPALIAGLGIWGLTSLFGLVAPLLVRGYAVFGVFVSLLAALLWLNLVATAFLLGAAWTRVRRDGADSPSILAARPGEGPPQPP